MRTVAQYAFKASCENEASASALFSKTEEIIHGWVKSKGVVDEQDKCVLYEDGRRANYERTQYDTSVGCARSWQLIEPILGGKFGTLIQLGRDGANVFIACRLFAGNTDNWLMPIRLSIRCPKVMRDILAIDVVWRVGNSAVPNAPVHYASAEEGRKCSDLLLSKDRSLPVIVVSSVGGLLLHPDIVDKMQADLAGLAIVAEIKEDAARALTRDLGKEKSCFNGAIRIYWPQLTLTSYPWHHPLWTHERLLKGTSGTAAASTRIRHTIRNRLLALSTYVIQPASIFENVETQYSRDIIKAQIQKAVDETELREIAETYAKENDLLRKKLSDKDNIIHELRQDLYRLQINRAWETQEGEVAPDTDNPLETVAEAVERSRKIHAGYITYGDDVDKGVSGLAPDAGPPQKIFEYLDGLAEMAKEMRGGSLGDSPMNWLRQYGIMSSNESETVCNSKDESIRRTWHDGRGRRIFESHLKPADGTSPDRCVRIYYDWDEVAQKITVGWIGRHP